MHPEERIGNEVANRDASCAELVDTIQMILERLESRAEDLHAHGGGDSTHNDTYDSLLQILKRLHEQAVVKCTKGEYNPELAERVEIELHFKQSPQVDVAALTERVKHTLQEIGVPNVVVGVVIAAVVAALLTLNPFPAIAALIGTAAAVIFFIAIGRLRDVPPDKLASASNSNSDAPTTSERRTT